MTPKRFSMWAETIGAVVKFFGWCILAGIAVYGAAVAVGVA